MSALQSRRYIECLDSRTAESSYWGAYLCIVCGDGHVVLNIVVSFVDDRSCVFEMVSMSSGYPLTVLCPQCIP
eukprot:3706628-Amphidinium_carterae.1